MIAESDPHRPSGNAQPEDLTGSTGSGGDGDAAGSGCGGSNHPSPGGGGGPEDGTTVETLYLSICHIANGIVHRMVVSVHIVACRSARSDVDIHTLK